MFQLISAFLLAFVLAPVVQAKQAPNDAPEQWLPYMPDSVFSQQTRLSADGALLSWYQLDEATIGADAPARARHFLGAHASRLGLSSDLGELAYLLTREGPAGSNVHFTQRLDGYPVFASRYVVHLSPQGRVTQFARSHAAPPPLNIRVPLLDAAQAQGIALASLQAQAPQEIEAELVAYPMALSSRLVWQVSLEAEQPRGRWLVLVDAKTGLVHARWDTVAYLHAEDHAASGSVFDPDPVSSSQTVYGQPLLDNDDSNYVEIAAEVKLRDLGQLKQERSFFWLSSAYAELVDTEAPNLGFFGQADSDFIFTRDEDGFEAVNVFWHVQESMRYINEDLGLALMPYQYAGGVRFDPHGLDGDDNSHYNSGSGEMAFGEGCVDDAEDADVVWHELGHGLHDWVTAGGLSNIIDGLSEGFGDYWAHSYSRSLGHWQPDTEEYHWVFNWDGHNECWGGRTTNYALPWPAGITPFPAIHTGGQIWSTSLMRIYDRIGRAKTDLMVLEGLAMTHMFSTQNDAANAVYQAAQDMGYSNDELQIIDEEFAASGYLRLDGLPLLAPSSSGAQSQEDEDPASREAEAGKAGGALGLWMLLLLPLLVGRRRT